MRQAPSPLRLLERLAGFALVSGVGLAIDFAIFLTLVALPSSPYLANAVSGTAAVTFVYFASVRRIFAYRGRFLYALFAAYLLYQVVGVALASLAVGLIAGLTTAVAAKLLILPITFSANFAFMSWLTRHGRQAALGGAR